MPLDKAPYVDGSLVSQTRWRRDESIEWRDNVAFIERLVVSDIERGNSSTQLILRSEDGHHGYPMFPTDMLHMLKTADIRQGQVTGRWDVVKRGAYYGLRYLGKATAD